MIFIAYVANGIVKRSRDLLNDQAHKKFTSLASLSFVLVAGLSSCGVPSAGCGDGVVCIENPATQNIATKDDILFGKFAHNALGELRKFPGFRWDAQRKTLNS